MRLLRTLFSGFDPIIFSCALLLAGFGVVTMFTYQGDSQYFTRQFVWIAVSVGALLLAMVPDYRFLRTSNVGFYWYLLIIGTLILLFFFGDISLGAQRRFDLGLFSFQPSDLAKLILIIVLAKYFSKRHEMIGDIKHIIVSGLYAMVLFGLIFLQPDFGTAMVLFGIWLGMVIVAGIKLRHLFTVFMLGTFVFVGLWQFAFADYQKARITSFLDPLADVQGAGYNAYQSQIAVGSGQVLGKGIGYGTQSKLLYLPEYQTDFIFASFSEEWGFVGVVVLFIIFGILIWRLLFVAVQAATNFETLFTVGVAIFLGTHFFVHIGMNIGLLPVTGLTMPFMSYGGSHLVTEFIALGMVMAMRRYASNPSTGLIDSL
jgi:rod shape determining protein RodA